MTRRSVLLMAVLLMLVLALPAFAQPGAGGGDGGRGRRMGGTMMQAPAMAIADGNLYIIYMGQLSMFNAKTLELIKTVPLPMPQPPMGGQPGGGAPPPPPPG